MSRKLDKNKIAFIHFQPVELYPPAMNLVNYLGEFTTNLILLFTNSLNKEINLTPFSSDLINIEILRQSYIPKNSLLRYYNYLKFYFTAIINLFYYRPSVVIYMESISSLPAIIYKKIFKNVQLIAHYHEYTSPEEYKNGMRLVKWMHQMELKMFHQYNWISHTNSVRLNKFMTDNRLLNLKDSIFHVMPNYPPGNWKKQSKTDDSTILKLVYIGSLGLESSYLREVIAWINKHQESITLDIYSFNIKEDALNLILKCNTGNIRYKGYYNYFEMPDFLKNYHCGLVLYKPETFNYLYNAPNKLFEYLACGLDVLIPDTMLYAQKYINHELIPRVFSIDFMNLENVDIASRLKNRNLPESNSFYISEMVYAEMLNDIQVFQRNIHD